MSQYRSNRPSRPTGTGYGMGTRTSVPPKTSAPVRTPASGSASTGGSRPSVPPSSSAASAAHSYGGSRSYAHTPPSAGSHRPSGKGKGILLIVFAVVIAAMAAGFLFFGAKPQPVPEPSTTETADLLPTATAAATASPPAATVNPPAATAAPAAAMDTQPQSELFRVYDPALRWYTLQLTSQEQELFALLYDGIANVQTTVSVPWGQFGENVYLIQKFSFLLGSSRSDHIFMLALMIPSVL